MALSRIATALGGLLLSKGGRHFAGRHAGKLALATLAFELWQQHQGRGTPQAQGKAQGQAQGQRSRPHPNKRWSGRRV